MLTSSVLGASGYVGGELLRLLEGHPNLKLQQAASTRFCGRPLQQLHPPLRGRTSRLFSAPEELMECDVLFVCLPHGKCSQQIDRLAEVAGTVVDCSADFRLRDPDVQARWYGPDSVSSRWRNQFTYGLPESERALLAGARRISGVGCNATAVNLGLLPLARRGWIERVVADVKVGSSEAGARGSEASHHPERSGAVRSFAPVGHRHQAEILQVLGLAEEALFFSVTAIEMVRGVLATLHVFLNEEHSDREVFQAYHEDYRQEPFVRCLRDRRGLYRLPEPKVLSGSNFCDVAFRSDDHGRRLVVMSALDNLVKGAAGSALQALNIACGFEETAGLGFGGLHPL
jgi:N-acetyl-gamma-glutamyl-phosphate/LysW-gamma-L-alpha-aminoadipyl-6-phosphate reductase